MEILTENQNLVLKYCISSGKVYTVKKYQENIGIIVKGTILSCHTNSFHRKSVNNLKFAT